MPAVDLSAHPGHLARRLQQAHYLLWTAMVSEEFTSPQFAVLNVLAAEDGLDQRTAGERAGIDRSTIAEMVSRLEGRSQLRRERDTRDGRRYVLRLTDEGRRTHQRLAARSARMNHVFLAPLSEEEQVLLLDLMHRVVDATEQLRSPLPPTTLEVPGKNQGGSAPHEQQDHGTL